MERITILFATLSITLAFIMILGVMAERVSALVRHYAPQFRYDGEIFLLWALSIWAAFTAGLAVMYAALHF